MAEQTTMEMDPPTGPEPDEPPVKDVNEDGKLIPYENRAGITVREEFGAVETSNQSETASTAVAARARASIEAGYVVALRRPRNWDQVRQDFLKECSRPSMAEVAFYSKPVGGKSIEGPSIRLAEVAKRCMSNTESDTMVVYEDGQKRIVKVTLTDLETNNRDSRDFTIAKTVERRKPMSDGTFISVRKNSYGDNVFLVPASEDEMLTKESAMVSKARRTLIFGMFPGDLLEEGKQKIQATLKNRAAADPDAERRKVADAFVSLGVTAVELGKYLGHDLAQTTPAELTELRTVFTALKDGEASWREILDAKGVDQPAENGGKSKTERMKNKLGTKEANV